MTPRHVGFAMLNRKSERVHISDMQLSVSNLGNY